MLEYRNFIEELSIDSSIIESMIANFFLLKWHPQIRSLSKRSKPPDKVSLSTSSVLSSGSNESSVPSVLSDKKGRIKQRCGCCKEEGNNRTTCVTLRARQEKARASACELNVVVNTLPNVEDTTSEDFVIPQQPPIKSRQSNPI
ncbi:hypothetical protein RCL1_002550 [Eukaryota sp. TZLM3-RCL]